LLSYRFRSHKPLKFTGVDPKIQTNLLVQFGETFKQKEELNLVKLAIIKRTRNRTRRISLAFLT
jgi:hypothetical protein